MEIAESQTFEESVETKKTFKCSQHLLDSLNVVYSPTGAIFIFWNKYQLFMYEDFNFNDTTRIFTPEFLVHEILILNNYLLCLDCSGNIHVTSLRFKNTAQKRLKTNFQPQEQNIIAFSEFGEHILSLKCESDCYSLCMNKVNTDFEMVKKIAVDKYDKWPLPPTTQGKCILRSHLVPQGNEDVRQLFDSQQSIFNDYGIVVLTFDKIHVFACLFSPETTEAQISLVKFYTCPSKICEIQIIEHEGLSVLIALNSGSLIILPLKKNSLKPLLIHLNIAIYNFKIYDDTIIYTNGIAMWKSEKIFSPEIKFSQFFIRHAKDFVMFGDQLICTTFTQLIYLVSKDVDSTYIKPESEDYCPAEKMLNNTEYLCSVLEKTEKNDDLVRRAEEESHYVTALALSNREDLMRNIMETEAVVYEYYEDVIKEVPNVMLTEDLKTYFEPKSLFFLIKMNIMQMESLVKKVLTKLLDRSRIHISLMHGTKLLKTSSVKIFESLKKVNVLVPLNYEQIWNVTELCVEVKIVLNLPGAYDNKETLWTSLYRKEIILNPEHFIKTNLETSKIRCLNKPEDSIHDLVAVTSENEHGALFQFRDVSNMQAKPKEKSLYVKLPENYKEILSNKEYYEERFNTRKAEFLLHQLSSEDFLKARSHLLFEIGNEIVKVEIVTDEVSVPSLKISSSDFTTAFKIRNFFSDFVYNDFNAYGPGMEFIAMNFYTVVESVQKAIKEGIEKESGSLMAVMEAFQRTVIGRMPI